MGLLDDVIHADKQYSISKDGKSMMMDAQHEEVSVMLMVRPGSLRNGLFALLKSIKGISGIEISEVPETGLEWVVRRQPELTIMAGNGFGDHMWSLVRETKRKSPATCFVLFSENLPEHFNPVDLPVDAIVQQGTHPYKLVFVIESLIQELKEKKGDMNHE
jgi:hypothetical protein